jgi:hypothetical protein
LLAWAFRALPKEKWQIIASVPLKKDDAGRWVGVNFTFYGVFVASAYLFAVIIFIILMGSTGVTLRGILYMVSASLFLCLPASWLLAIVVEKKRYTLTVGGAALVGLLIAPAVILVVRNLAGTTHLELMPGLAAMCIAYLVGEGVGRLACISFGCCYGRPLHHLGPLGRRWLSRICFTFSGQTKKIAYESDLEGVKVVPIQGVTSTLLLTCALVSIFLFLNGWFHSAFALSILFSQFWRIFSEIFRADFRGRARFTAYQRMGVVAIVYAFLLLSIVPSSPAVPINLVWGLGLLWQPAVILVLQLIWIGLFFLTGCSMVTSSVLSFHVRRERT